MSNVSFSVVSELFSACAVGFMVSKDPYSMRFFVLNTVISIRCLFLCLLLCEIDSHEAAHWGKSHNEVDGLHEDSQNNNFVRIMAVAELQSPCARQECAIIGYQHCKYVSYTLYELTAVTAPRVYAGLNENNM